MRGCAVPAVYFDGTCSARNEVTVEAAAAGLRILAGGGDGRDGLPDRVLDEWAYSELRRMSAPEGVLRLGRRGETLLARLEIRALRSPRRSKIAPRRSIAAARRNGDCAAKSWL